MQIRRASFLLNKSREQQTENRRWATSVPTKIVAPQKITTNSFRSPFQQNAAQPHTASRTFSIYSFFHFWCIEKNQKRITWKGVSFQLNNRAHKWWCANMLLEIGRNVLFLIRRCVRPFVKNLAIRVENFCGDLMRRKNRPLWHMKRLDRALIFYNSNGKIDDLVGHE